jgi:hypothetical protein
MRLALRNHALHPQPDVARNEKPGAVSRPGLGTLLKDIFLYMSSVSTSRSHKLKSQVAQKSQVAPRIGCIRHPKKYLSGTHRWRPDETQGDPGYRTKRTEVREQPIALDVLDYLLSCQEKTDTSGCSRGERI